MGQAESLSISGGDGHRYWVSIRAKPVNHGRKKTVYKGILLGAGPRQGEKVVVKAFSDISGSQDTWKHEVTKADLTKQIARLFLDQRKETPEIKIRIVLPGIVEMDKVSKLENWREERSGRRGLQKDEWISIEEHITGQFCRFCPWTLEGAHGADPVTHSDLLQTFSHFTFMQSCGELVSCDFQGVSRVLKSGQTLYIVTDSIIHSRHKLYGIFDEGDQGINEFFKLHKCTNTCKGWPKPCPLTPPPSFDEACAQLLGNITPPPTFTNIVFPSYQGEEIPRNNEPSDLAGRKRHTSERHQRHGVYGQRVPAQVEMVSHDTQCIEDTLSRRRHASERRAPQRGQQHTLLHIPVATEEGLRPRSHSNAGESLAQYLEQHRRRSGAHCGHEAHGEASVAASDTGVSHSSSGDPTTETSPTVTWSLHSDSPPSYESVCGAVRNVQHHTKETAQETSVKELEALYQQHSIAQNSSGSDVSQHPPNNQQAAMQIHTGPTLIRSTTLPTISDEELNHLRPMRRTGTLCTSSPSTLEITVTLNDNQNEAVANIAGGPPPMSPLLQRRVNSSTERCQAEESFPLTFPRGIQMPQRCFPVTSTTTTMSPPVLSPSAPPLEQDGYI